MFRVSNLRSAQTLKWKTSAPAPRKPVTHPRPKILLVAGARPNFMKIAPIVRELERRWETFDYKIVHTGQHYDREMSDNFFDELGIPIPHYTFRVGSGSHAVQTAKIMTRFEEVCGIESPALVLVVGDVNSTLACSIAAKKLCIPVAHVEAGLRSGDRSMPEEINRLVTDAISDYFFVTEQRGVDNLRTEGKAGKHIFFVGHVMIDNLFFQLEQLKHLNHSTLLSHARKSSLPHYGVVTLHRPSNVDNEAILHSLMEVLGEIGKEIPLIFPIHPRTKGNLDRFRIPLPNTIIYEKPLPYLDFLNLFKDAKVVLTDSGGIQEETTALGIPCLTLRDNTERPCTVEEGSNILVGTSPKVIAREVSKVLSGSGKPSRIPKFWDGNASERILNHLDHIMCG